MTSYVLPRFCTRAEALEILTAALVLHYRSGWAAPGGFKEGRAIHLTRRLQAYRDWCGQQKGAGLMAAHLALGAEVMLRFHPDDWRDRGGMNPWVFDSEFAQVCEMVDGILAGLPAEFKAWGPGRASRAPRAEAASQ